MGQSNTNTSLVGADSPSQKTESELKRDINKSLVLEALSAHIEKWYPAESRSNFGSELLDIVEQPPVGLELPY